MSFGMTPATGWPVPTPDDFPEFIQFQEDGVNLGGPDADTVNFTGNVSVTRGEGENANVITVDVAADGSGTGGGAVDSVNGQTGVVVLTATDIGLGNVDNTSDANKPVSTAQQTAFNLKAPLASPTFTGTVAGITKAMVGLGSVDDTSDANKPVSTAQQTALNLKAPLASPTFTGTVAGITKTMVGLGNVDNTSDANKPVSTAQQTALNLKADLASPALTGTPTAPTPATADSSTKIATTAMVQAAIAAGSGPANGGAVGAQALTTLTTTPTTGHTYGDSYTAATGAISYSDALTLRMGFYSTAHVNHAISGDQAADQSEVAHAVSVSTSMINTLLIGLNDARQYGNTAAKMAAFQAAHLELAAWLALPTAGRLTGRSAGITYVGTWTNDANNGDIAKKSTTPGDTAAFTATGSTIYIGSRVANSNADSSFTVHVDGALVGTYDCDPGAVITTQNGQTYSSQLIRISGLDDVQHSVLVTVVGPTGTVYIEWVAAFSGPVSPAWPRLVVGNIANLNSTGYAVPPANASDLIISQYNGMIYENIQTLVGDGLAIGFANIARSWDAGTMLAVDGVHPNTAGYQYVNDSFFNLFASLRIRSAADIAMNSTWAAYAAGFEPRATLRDGIVYLTGVVKKNGSVSTTIGTLPAGMWPTGEDRYLPVLKDAGATQVFGGLKAVAAKNASPGTLVIDVLPTDNVSLDGVSFVLAQEIA